MCIVTDIWCIEFQSQVSQLNPYRTSPLLEQVEAMYPEGAPEFVIDQGMYYPTATNYGFYCTGNLNALSVIYISDAYRISGVCC